MVERSGYDELAAKIKTYPVSASVLAEVESKGRHLISNERRTVTHKFERMLDSDVFAVGNIRIGLEYRLLPQINSEGLAIHVLTDIAGQTSLDRTWNYWRLIALIAGHIITTALGIKTYEYIGTLLPLVKR